MKMMTKKQMLDRLRYIKRCGYEYSAAVKVVTTPDEIEMGERNGSELRIVPVIIDTEEQFDYTMTFVRLMVRKDDREIVFGSKERLEYLCISGAHTEEESNAQIKKAVAEYCKANGYGTVKSEGELVGLAAECLAEHEAQNECAADGTH